MLDGPLPPRNTRPELSARGDYSPGRAVFFNRLGEMRDRSFENQRYRAVEHRLSGTGRSKRSGKTLIGKATIYPNCLNGNKSANGETFHQTTTPRRLTSFRLD
jgi:rare lipoprotein A (peptidoglycan hydrolase)